MSDMPTRDQYEQNLKVAEACGADGPGARTLARGGEHAGLLVSDAVKACYDAGGPGDKRGGFQRFTDNFKGLLSGTFDRAAQAVEATGLPELGRDLGQALDNAGTENSLQNQRWERQMNQAGPGI